MDSSNQIGYYSPDEETSNPILYFIFSSTRFWVKDTLDYQRLNILVNGHLIMNYTISHPESQEIVAEIDRTVFDEDIQMLTFELPDASSPYETERSNDIRTLGIAVQTVTLT